MSASGELARVAALRARFARPAKGVVVGIGDDAAVLEGGLVWTVDAQVEGTHFRSSWLTWEDVGWRSFMAAASDLAAMGAEPLAALSALVLAPSVDDGALDAIARGQAAAADAIGTVVVGGNLARGTETSITTTLLGRSLQPVLRSGARPGDRMWLAGHVGLAGAGLAALQVDLPEGLVQDARVQNADIAMCVEAWRRPRARMAAGHHLVGVAHAAIDLSDGLVHDAWQLAEASGVAVVLDARAVMACATEHVTVASAVLGRDVLSFALHGGEDYALLAASADPLPGFEPIGTVVPYAGGARVMLATSRGTEPLQRTGFDHFG